MGKAAPKTVVLSRSVEQELSTYVREFQKTDPQKSAHLLNLAISACKWLILKGESDSLRLQSAKTLIELPPVQARLAAMTRAVQLRYHRDLHADSPRNVALLREVEAMVKSGDEAELLEIFPANATKQTDSE